jgi:hypothetical protein
MYYIQAYKLRKPSLGCAFDGPSAENLFVDYIYNSIMRVTDSFLYPL